MSNGEKKNEGTGKKKKLHSVNKARPFFKTSVVNLIGTLWLRSIYMHGWVWLERRREREKK